MRQWGQLATGAFGVVHPIPKRRGAEASRRISTHAGALGFVLARCRLTEGGLQACA
jgi:hypothetical protein